MTSFIKNVLIYRGHETSTILLGPYSENIKKRVEMFNDLNKYRVLQNRKPWNVSTVSGEHLVATLEAMNPEETLLVIPAGQSSNLDKVFSVAQCQFLKHHFFVKGGRGYLNCGSAYWASAIREYSDVCSEEPSHPRKITKKSKIPLFEGISRGPLCSYPGVKYKVGFFSDAVNISSGSNSCTIYLSGGGSFLPSPQSNQRCRVLVRYQREELLRLGVQSEDLHDWENAAILVSVGAGAVLMSMFHPYYGSQDIDVGRYEKTFPDCGTNWKEVHQRLSSVETRMNFVMNNMLNPLEDRLLSIE